MRHMSKPIRISGRMLQAKGACKDQRDLFNATFGASVIVTPTVFDEHASKFNWDWAAENLLSALARAEYDRVRAPTFAKLYIKDNQVLN